MQHSYDGLDRPGGFSRLNLFAPLRHRDFRLLWAGMTVSLVGDGIFLVAMAWQVYAVWNAPAALSVVGIAMTVPDDRVPAAGRRGQRPHEPPRDHARRRCRAGGRDRACWRRCRSPAGSRCGRSPALAMVYGAGTAFFTPAFEALVPDILPASDLPAANSLDQFVRPIALRLAGPAVGGWIIAAFGPGVAFAADAASFAGAGVAVLAMRPVPRHGAGGPVGDGGHPQRAASSSAGRTWIWGTLVSAAFAYLLFLGPTEVLLPYVVKNGLHGSAGTLGAVFAAGGIGSIGAAVLMGQRDAAAPPGDVHLHRLDARDAGRRRLRAGHRDLAARGRLPALQRARDGRDDRVGDAQAAPRARVDARARVEPRLADLDRPAAALVCAHRAASPR